MKKTIYILAALAASFAISCNKGITTEEPNNEVETPKVEMQTITFTANIDEKITRSSYAGGTTFNWDAGDEISVYCSDGNFYNFRANTTGTSTTFTGAIPSGESLGNYALFPADAGHTHGNFSLPRYKDLTSHYSAEIPMVGLKGEGNVYSFVHCAGAALLTITNIPSDITSVTITVESAHASDPTHCIKLSGSFYINSRETTTPYWSGAYAATSDEKQFSRKVPVTNHTAQVYVICPGGYTNNCPNKLTVVGHTASTDVPLFTEKAMKKLGQVNRAHVLPLTELPLNNLSRIDWSDAGIAMSEVDPSDSRKCLTELKATADSYYMYTRVKGPLSLFSGDYLDVYLSDGAGEHYALSDENKYWSTGGETVYREEHKGPVTSSSLSLTFNTKSVDTVTENSGDDIFWYIAFPRTAHSLLSSSGKVYVGFVLWNGWGVTGVIPTKYSAMLEVALP